MINLREMTQADIPAGLSLCRSAGWNQLEVDWNVFISQSTYGNVVAVNGELVVGTAATITYDDRFSWIGMVLVDPAMKRQGIGTKLLNASLERLNNQESIKLDATPAGREVYLKLGFTDEYVLSRMMIPQNPLTKNNWSDAGSEDFSLVLATDEKVFGASRKKLLETYHRFYPQFSSIKNASTYCFGRRGYNFTQVGPVVADNVNDAIDITSKVLQHTEGAVVLDVMENSAFSNWLSSIGFMEQRKLIRMYRGANNYPGIPGKQFAILGPEFG